MTYRDIVQDALTELGILAAEAEASAADSTFVLGRMNDIFDYWNGLGIVSYVEEYTTPLAGSAIAPHTIGPSGATYTVALRPEVISSASLRSGLLSTSTRLRELTLRDEEWWRSLSSPGTTGTPTDLFYRPTFPNGEFHFWPLPSGAFYWDYWARHQYATTGDLNTTFTLPPGFKSAVTKALAVEIAPAFEKQPSPITMEGARMALSSLISTYARKPKHMTSDVGHPYGYWDIQTSTFR